jgi:hypothetical protein
MSMRDYILVFSRWPEVRNFQQRFRLWQDISAEIHGRQRFWKPLLMTLWPPILRT